jgi:hypothetical protein
MFGLPKIVTKADPFAELTRSVDAAIAIALLGGVSRKRIVDLLEGLAKRHQPEYRHPSADFPRHVDGHGKLINYPLQAEQGRLAREQLRQQQENDANAGRKRIR